MCQMKNGFNYHGIEIDTMGALSERIQSSAQWGKQVDDFPSTARSKDCMTTGFRNFQLRAFAALW